MLVQCSFQLSKYKAHACAFEASMASVPTLEAIKHNQSLVSPSDQKGTGAQCATQRLAGVKAAAKESALVVFDSYSTKTACLVAAICDEAGRTTSHSFTGVTAFN
jgi:hypothetical protein